MTCVAFIDFSVLVFVSLLQYIVCLDSLSPSTALKAFRNHNCHISTSLSLLIFCGAVLPSYHTFMMRNELLQSSYLLHCNLLFIYKICSFFCFSFSFSSTFFSLTFSSASPSSFCRRPVIGRSVEPVGRGRPPRIKSSLFPHATLPSRLSSKALFLVLDSTHVFNLR